MKWTESLDGAKSFKAESSAIRAAKRVSAYYAEGWNPLGSSGNGPIYIGHTGAAYVIYNSRQNGWLFKW